jgi:hypothetical protein
MLRHVGQKAFNLDSEVEDSSEAGFSGLPQTTLNIQCWFNYLNINAE